MINFVFYNFIIYFKYCDIVLVFIYKYFFCIIDIIIFVICNCDMIYDNR